MFASIQTNILETELQSFQFPSFVYLPASQPDHMSQTLVWRLVLYTLFDARSDKLLV